MRMMNEFEAQVLTATSLTKTCPWGPRVRDDGWVMEGLRCG
jgi:hypothetical protein